MIEVKIGAGMADGDSYRNGGFGDAVWNEFATGADDSSGYVIGGRGDGHDNAGGDGNNLGAFDNLTLPGDGIIEGTGNVWDHVLSDGGESEGISGGDSGDAATDGGNGQDVLDVGSIDVALGNVSDGGDVSQGSGGDEIGGAVSGSDVTSASWDVAGDIDNFFDSYS